MSSVNLNSMIRGIIDFRTAEQAQAIEDRIENLSDGSRSALVERLQDLPLDFPERRRIDQMVRGILYSIPKVFEVLVQAYPQTARATDVGEFFYESSDNESFDGMTRPWCSETGTLDPKQETLWHWAVEIFDNGERDAKRIEIINTLFRYAADLLHVTNAIGCTPLHFAAGGVKDHSLALLLRMARRAPEALDIQYSGSTPIQMVEHIQIHCMLTTDKDKYEASARALKNVRENEVRMKTFLFGLMPPPPASSSSSSSSSVLPNTGSS